MSRIKQTLDTGKLKLRLHNFSNTVSNIIYPSSSCRHEPRGKRWFVCVWGRKRGVCISFSSTWPKLKPFAYKLTDTEIKAYLYHTQLVHNNLIDTLVHIYHHHRHHLMDIHAHRHKLIHPHTHSHLKTYRYKIKQTINKLYKMQSTLWLRVGETRKSNMEPCLSMATREVGKLKEIYFI